MQTHHIRQGRDIPLAGPAENRIVDGPAPSLAAVQPPDFHGLRFRVLAKEGVPVRIGTPLLEDKDDPRIKVVSPLAGRVKAVRRGEKRALLAVIVEAGSAQEAEQQTRFSSAQIPGLSRGQIIEHLLATGMWALIRQRPFNHIADPDTTPKAIFIRAMNTDPLAPDTDTVLDGQQEDLRAGLKILSRLTRGAVHLCFADKETHPLLREAEGVECHAFYGPHPAGNVGTHIHTIDPLGKNEAVWHIDAQDAAAIARSFTSGTFEPGRIIAVAGEHAETRVHKRTIIGAYLRDIIGQKNFDNTRVISGSVLSGRDAGADGFLGFYAQQVTLLPAAEERRLLGWVLPGFGQFSLTRMFASALQKTPAVRLNTDTHGSPRAIVLNAVYDKYVALDVLTFFLLRAVMAGDIEEMERLGILECAPEDFALAAFVCPSKTDVCGIIQDGLDLMEREG